MMPMAFSCLWFVQILGTGDLIEQRWIVSGGGADGTNDAPADTRKGERGGGGSSSSTPQQQEQAKLAAPLLSPPAGRGAE